MSTHYTMGHNRKHIRLREWDYRSPGRHYVTVCLQDIRCVLATPADTRLQTTQAGRIADEYWRQIPARFPHVNLD